MKSTYIWNEETQDIYQVTASEHVSRREIEDRLADAQQNVLDFTAELSDYDALVAKQSAPAPVVEAPVVAVEPAPVAPIAELQVGEVIATEPAPVAPVVAEVPVAMDAPVFNAEPAPVRI